MRPLLEQLQEGQRFISYMYDCKPRLPAASRRRVWCQDPTNELLKLPIYCYSF